MQIWRIVSANIHVWAAGETSFPYCNLLHYKYLHISFQFWECTVQNSLRNPLSSIVFCSKSSFLVTNHYSRRCTQLNIAWKLHMSNSMLISEATEPTPGSVSVAFVCSKLQFTPHQRLSAFGPRSAAIGTSQVRSLFCGFWSDYYYSAMYTRSQSHAANLFARPFRKTTGGRSPAESLPRISCSST